MTEHVYQKRGILWNIGHGDREYAHETGDSVLGRVIAATRSEAIEKALANQWASAPNGILFAPAGFWAWPAGDGPTMEITDITTDARAAMVRSGARLLGTFSSWEEFSAGNWTFDTAEPTCHVTEDANGIHFWVFEDDAPQPIRSPSRTP